MKFYVTFGQVHVHRVNGKTFDKDSIAMIEAPTHEEAREIAFDCFGPKFFTTYEQSALTEKFLSRFPRGIIALENKGGEG